MLILIILLNHGDQVIINIGDLYEQFLQVSENYPGLQLVQDDNEEFHIKGNLCFQATYNNITLEDDFDIVIKIPRKYPTIPPKVSETKGKIPQSFHRYENKNLCLGTPFDVYLRFIKNPTLLAFIEKILIPHLYSFTYQLKHNSKMPYDDQKHGGEGIIDFYCNFFGINDNVSVMGFLKLLAENKYKGHYICPCKSGDKLKHCHGAKLFKMKNMQLTDLFLIEYVHAYLYCIQNNINLPRDYQSEKAIKYLDK